MESNRWTTTKAEHTLLNKITAREAIEERMKTTLHRNSVTCRSKTVSRAPETGYITDPTTRATDEPGIHYYQCTSSQDDEHVVYYRQHDDYESGEDQESGDEESGDESTGEFSLADVHDHTHATVSSNLETLLSGQRQYW